MENSYVEVLVKRQSKPQHMAIKIGMLLLTVLFLLAGFLVYMLFFIPALALMAADYKLLPMLDKEYEYLYVGGELTIDVISGKTRRKQGVVTEMDKIELIAPAGSMQMKEKEHLKCVEYDYTSGREDAKVYACIFHTEKAVCKVLFEPNERMLGMMRQNAPRKVVADL